MHWIAQVSRDVIADFFAVLVLLAVFGGGFVLGSVKGVRCGRKWERNNMDEEIAAKLGVKLP